MPSSNRYKATDKEFIKAVAKSFSIAEVLKKLGLTIFGSAYKSFHLRVKELNLDTSHFTGQGHLKGKKHNWGIKIPLKELLIQDSNKVLSSGFKKRIISAGLLKYECSKCKLGDKWCGEPITLQIDHINGNPFDHRIENLQILCPNCHTQTKTFCSKNKSGEGKSRSKVKKIREPRPKKQCATCKSELKDHKATNCVKCYRANRKELQTPYERKTKIKWPPIKKLLKMLEKSNFCKLAKELGVSDNAIRKHIKNNTKK